jgi:fructuronate reductase
MSLDNLPGNGQHLRMRLLALAQGEPALQGWLAQACTFPCSMVDRIVPATTPGDTDRIAQRLGLHDAWPVMAEPYLHWVLEDRFAAGRPDWPGVTWVSRAEEVQTWEAAKLRVVNGAHSALAYLSMAAGWQTVDEALAQPGLRAYLQALLHQEVLPGLLPHAPPAAYVQAVLQRFTNPALAHQTAQIAMDGSQKLPLRLLPTLRANLAAGRPVQQVALAVAAWLQYQRGHNDAGQPHAIHDPLAAALAAHHTQAQALPDTAARAAWWAGFTPVFGDLAHHPAWHAALAHAWAALQRQGSRGLLAHFLPN